MVKPSKVIVVLWPKRLGHWQNAEPITLKTQTASRPGRRAERRLRPRQPQRGDRRRLDFL